jgi:hydrophobic/amphiphilic exporter-1 (mainly G- bacteria), HAE1 family
MSLPERAVNRPITAYMAFAAVVVIGIVSLRNLAVDLLPDIEFPGMSVVTYYEGVGPEEIETIITRPIEEVLSTVQGLEKIESVSAEGLSQISLQFSWDTSLDGAVSDVRSMLDRLSDYLPEDAGTPTVYKFDINALPIIFMSLSGDMDSWRLRKLADDKIKYRLERLEGVASVSVRGGENRQINIELDAAALSALRITPAMVVATLRRENVNLPAGDILDRGREVILRTLGEFESLDDVRNAVITSRDGHPITVAAVARVVDGFEEKSNIVRINGKPGIRISVSKLSGANTVAVSSKIRQEVAAINADYPMLTLEPIFDTADYINDSIANVESSISWGAVLAVTGLFFFLASLRSTMIIGVAIPISVVATFALIYLFDYTLNMITFAGLALGIGMLVDSAIVILENIQRRRTLGDGPIQAAVNGANEVSNAIIASTMTTLCVFAPVIFITGFAGIFFGQMAAVVCFALLCSLAVALTLVPVLYSRFDAGQANGKTKDVGRPGSLESYLIMLPTHAGLAARKFGEYFNKVEDRYESLIERVLRRPKVVVLAAIATLIVTAALMPLVGVELFPASDSGDVTISGELPVGTPLEVTDKIGLEIYERIKLEVPEMKLFSQVSGSSGYWSSRGDNSFRMRVRLVDLERRSRSSDEVASQIRKLIADIPDLDARVRASEGFFLFRILRGGGERLAVEVRGFDLTIGDDLARRIKKKMLTVEGVTDVDIDREESNREAIIRIERQKAAEHGLNVSIIGDAVATYFLGKTASYYREGGDEYDIFLRLRAQDRKYIGQLAALPILTSSGNTVLLGDLARITRREGPVKIKRLDQERIITISAGFSDRDLGSINSDAREVLAEIVPPDGFEISFGGEEKERKETFASLGIGFLLAIVLTYMVMASLFESFLHPFIIMFSVPFAFIGVILALLLTGTTFSIYSFLGTIILVGIVVNNAIVLIDYINLTRRNSELSLDEAIVKASRRRLRPIAMTSLTTILALLPVSLGIAEGSEMQAPLARAVIGGLITSSLITLVLIPVVYRWLENRLLQRRLALEADQL